MPRSPIQRKTADARPITARWSLAKIRLEIADVFACSGFAPANAVAASPNHRDLNIVLSGIVALCAILLLPFAAFASVKQRVLSSDQALVRSPEGEVFVIEFGKRRRVLDLETEEALIISNCAKKIQSDVLNLLASDIRAFDQGEDYPSKRIKTETITVFPHTKPSKRISIDPKLLPDGLLIRSPSGEVFLKEFSAKRKIQDLNSRNAILAINRAKHLQSDVISLTENQIRAFNDGEAFPLRQDTNQIRVAYAAPEFRSKTLAIPKGWRPLLILGSADHHQRGIRLRDVRGLKVRRVHDPQDPEQESIRITAPKGAGGFIRIIFEQGSSDPLSEPLPPVSPIPIK